MRVLSRLLVATFLSNVAHGTVDPVLRVAKEAEHFSLNLTELCGNWTIDLNDYLASTPLAQTQISCSELRTTGRQCKDHVTLDMPELCKGLARPVEVPDAELFGKLGLDMNWACEPFKEKLMPTTEDAATLFADGFFYKTAPDEQLNKIRLKRTTSNESVLYEISKSDEDGSLSLTVFANTHRKLAKLPDWIFSYFGGVKFSLSRICSTSMPLDLIESNDNPPIMDEAESAMPIGIDLSIVKNLDMKELAAKLKNDTELDDIFQRFVRMRMIGEKPFPSSFVLPILKRSNYDPRTPPMLFSGQTVDVRVGIHVQSMSNFELPTMDYDMDLWLRMTWRDPRLAHGFPRPILINEQTFLKKLWRPDPFFSNAKDSLFHKVTFLNFYMLIFPNGEMFFESRLYLKPSCQLVLCRYPHDNQACSVKLTSIGFTNDVVQFYWFSRMADAIFMNRNVQFPDLFVFNHEKKTCNGMRKSGNFSCLEAKFFLKRNLGSHLAQTYIPTATCVLFSWISVWLPEEFVEGRVFVSLTVFLTLSAENSAAKEVLPKVSYIKAIDIWFGFTTTFVFSTMLQAIIVISFEHNSRMIQKKAESSKTSLSAHDFNKLMMQSKMYHRWGRGLDAFCKVMYPVLFLIFLFFYFFIIIQGDDNKCLREAERHTEL